MKRGILNIEFIAFSFLLLLCACEESLYQERNISLSKNYKIIDCQSKTHHELLELFLLDFDEQIINETEIFEALQDSIDYYIRNGYYTIRSSYNDSTKKESTNLFYQKEDGIIRCFFYTNHFVYKLNEFSNIIYNWDQENSYKHYNDTIINQMLDFKNSEYMISSNTFKVDSFPETTRPRKSFSLGISGDYPFYSLYAFKEFIANTKTINSRLRHLKSELYFNNNYGNLKEHQRYFINRYYPFYLNTHIFFRPLPPSD